MNSLGMLKHGVCRGAEPLAGSLRVSLRNTPSSFLTRKEAIPFNTDVLDH